MNPLAAALIEEDPSPARLRALLDAELARGERALHQKRSGYDDPVRVAFGPGGEAVLPVPVALRADPAVVDERSWRLVATVVGALQAAADLPPAASGADLRLTAGEHEGRLTLAGLGADPELAALAFDEAAAAIDRLRAGAVVLPAGVIAARDPRAPIGPAHPLRVAEAVARLGGDPAAPTHDEDEAVLALLDDAAAKAARPHDDPDPARRVVRRILQRLDGMGKWGGYHTDFTHLARGFAGNDRALAEAVGEALIDAGLLSQKPSVGQRHVFLNPRRAGEIRRLLEEGEVPATLKLPKA